MSKAGRIERVLAKRVVRTFGATVALRGIDLELKAGELTLIEGANGSGKTTLLRILGTILRPTSGRVSYPPHGRQLHDVRREVGWLSHEALAYGDLSGRENIALAARLHGLDPAEAWDRISERFRLGRFADRPLRTNSRGQRQRVALGRALVHEPSLVLLDEPTTGLDKSGVDRLLQVVDQEQRDGAVVAVVSHEPALFVGLADRRIELERGKVVHRNARQAPVSAEAR